MASIIITFILISFPAVLCRQRKTTTYILMITYDLMMEIIGGKRLAQQERSQTRGWAKINPNILREKNITVILS